MQQRKNFLPQSRQSFVCKQCGASNTDNHPSPRNHCRSCLCSLHVDENVPGDRKSTCSGLMLPLRIEVDAKRGFMIIHHCERCGKEARNKSAPDDNTERMAEITRQHART